MRPYERRHFMIAETFWAVSPKSLHSVYDERGFPQGGPS
jgi:hypothetical protein